MVGRVWLLNGANLAFRCVIVELDLVGGTLDRKEVNGRAARLVG